jgi:hypothetical protein
MGSGILNVLRNSVMDDERPVIDEIRIMDDEPDDDTSAMMLIPMLWATKMMEANNEFLAELASISLDDDPKSIVKRMLERRMLGRGKRSSN